MFDRRHYALIDFGGGEKLERFGNVTIRRQTPSVDEGSRRHRPWKSDAHFVRDTSTTQAGTWQINQTVDDSWSIAHAGKQFLLKLSPSGQVGVFPEQVENWQWIERQSEDLRGLQALNLFGYTGGTTMALAKCGVSVTHVDAAKPAVAWARQNAAASGLGQFPIRWIVDDAVSFMRREVKRNRSYQVIVADPPSFGRGPNGSVWKIQRDLETLLKLAADLSKGQLKMLVLSCHTPGLDANDLKRTARRWLDIDKKTGQAMRLKIESESGAALPSGHCFRWSRTQ